MIYLSLMGSGKIPVKKVSVHVWICNRRFLSNHFVKYPPSLSAYPFWNEILFVIRGEVEVIDNQNSWHLAENDLLLNNANDVHTLKGMKKMWFYCCKFLFIPSSSFIGIFIIYRYKRWSSRIIFWLILKYEQMR